jgi:hypothetical protein
MKPIILDLCGGTGAWSRPWLESGEYDVRIITLPEHDVRTYQPPQDVYGILAAPPCTHFSVSGARFWEEKDKDGRTLKDTQILSACLMIIAKTKPVFWVIENPVGRMRDWIGKPVMRFDPCDFGDPYTKRTCLWGRFNIPASTPVEPQYIIGKRDGKKYSPIHFVSGSDPNREKVRSITPPGFAKAFFEANRIRDETVMKITGKIHEGKTQENPCEEKGALINKEV